MNSKPYKEDWYANVPGSTRRNCTSRMPNEHTYYNTASNYHRYYNSTRGTYNTNQLNRSNNTNIYMNVPNNTEPIYSNVSYPIYENVNPIGKLSPKLGYYLQIYTELQK